jgi:hypothetical protein
VMVRVDDRQIGIQNRFGHGASPERAAQKGGFRRSSPIDGSGGKPKRRSA